MADTSDLIQFLESRFDKQIKAHHVIDPEPGHFSDYPADLDPRLRSVLEGQKIPSLYAHQGEAFEAITRGEDTVLVSRTASGKTLSFLLPILNEYIKADAPFGVMLLYPTKALSRDQESTLGKLLHAAMDNRKLGTFDGDTPAEERRNIQRQADFVITNPNIDRQACSPC